MYSNLKLHDDKTYCDTPFWACHENIAALYTRKWNVMALNVAANIEERKIAFSFSDSCTGMGKFIEH